MKKEQKLYTPEEFFGCFEGYTKEEVLKALDNLKENNKKIMELRYGLNGKKAMRINEIRQLYNLTSVQVNNVINNSKARIKEILGKIKEEEKYDNVVINSIILNEEFRGLSPSNSDEEIIEAFYKLTEKQKEILTLHYGLDGNGLLSCKQISEKLGVKYSCANSRIYTSKARLDELLREMNNKKSENIDLQKEKEDIKINQKLDDNKDKKLINQSVSDKETINVDNILVEDCINIISLLRNPIYSKFVEKFDPKELVIVLLKLGYINDTYYSTKQVSEFLNIDEQTIEKITKNGLVLYKENISNYVDAAINKMIEEPMVFIKNNK